MKKYLGLFVFLLMVGLILSTPAVKAKDGESGSDDSSVSGGGSDDSTLTTDDNDDDSVSDDDADNAGDVKQEDKIKPNRPLLDRPMLGRPLLEDRKELRGALKEDRKIERQKMEEARKVFVDKLKTEREAFKTKVEQEKSDFKTANIEKKKEFFAKAGEVIGQRFVEAIKKLEDLQARVGTAIEKFSALGKDTSGAQTNLDLSKSKLAEAKTKLEETKALLPTDGSQITPEIFAQVKLGARTAKDLLKESKDALKNSIDELKALRGEDNSSESTSTESADDNSQN
jgi:multidrug resistance efflux pump